MCLLIVMSVALAIPQGGESSCSVDNRQAGETKVVSILPGERWWGGTVAQGWRMPLDATSDYEKDLRVESDGNQAAPLLLSTKGRWIWCEDAFRYSFKDGKITLQTGPCPRKARGGGHTMAVAPAAQGPAENPALTTQIPNLPDEALRNLPNLERTCYSKKTFAPLQVGRTGDSIRTAFEYCSRTFFPPKGTPQLRFFEQPILNTWVELNYNQNQEDVIKYAQSFIANGMKPGVLMIDCFWQTDAFGPWVFHAARFSDPRAMSDRLHAMGYKLMLWNAPFVTLDSMTYRKLRQDGGILKDARLIACGKGVYQGLPVEWWDGYSAVYDPTSPAGRAWYRDMLKRVMQDYGVDGFFFDGGGPYEYPPGDYIAFENAAQPTDLCRAFQMVAAEVPYQQLREAWKMGGLPLMNTLRDKEPRWGEMRRCITDMIAAGQLGYPFVVADLVGGGTCGNNGNGVHGVKWQDELFVRHLQIECLSPMIQFSGSPWRVLSSSAQDIVRKMLVLREKYAPRIVEIAVNTGKTGLPMLRSMDFQFPNKGYELVLDQFMMGDDLLVAPVVEGGAKTRTVVIPEGRWLSDRGEVVVGPKTIVVDTPLERLPYFERQ